MPIEVYLTLILLAAVFLFYGFKIAPWRLRVKKYELEFDKTLGSFAGKRIVFFSDIHVGPNFTCEHLSKLCQLIIAQEPQLILFGGDLLEEKTDITDDILRTEITNELKLLSDYCPCYAVMGNHDTETVQNRLYTTAVLEASEFTILKNSWAEINDLALFGLKNATHDFPAFIERDDLSHESFKLVLCHEPDFVGKFKPAEANTLYLSGHSHGGQVTFFGIPLILPYLARRHIRGCHHLTESSQLLISNGVGTVHIHARFCARPDIIVLDFPKNP
ncbi:MAG: metallophosphoesterase [Eubacteriales bacterium]|nr:metallophosphoesterase [Eubacteriales bacterium]